MRNLTKSERKAYEIAKDAEAVFVTLPNGKSVVIAYGYDIYRDEWQYALVASKDAKRVAS